MNLPNKIYLPPLPYPLNGLEPVIDQEVLDIHYNGHHKSYVEKYNKLILDPKASKEDIVFNYNGHLLHSLYWNSMTGLQQTPHGKLKDHLKNQLGFDYNNIIKEKLLKLAKAIKGSGWAALVLDPVQNIIRTRTIPNHELEVISNMIPLLVVDSWEHAYYLQYKNQRAEFLDEFYSLLNWDQAESRYRAAKKLV